MVGFTITIQTAVDLIKLTVHRLAFNCFGYDTSNNLNNSEPGHCNYIQLSLTIEFLK